MHNRNKNKYKKLFDGKRYRVALMCNGVAVIDKFSHFSRPGLPIENIVWCGHISDLDAINLYAKQLEERNEQGNPSL